MSTLKKVNKKGARILLYDIEVTPTLGWTYGIWETNVIKVEREPYIMCFAYQWLGEKEVHVISQIDFHNYTKNLYNDKNVVTELWKLMNEADIVVAHNAGKFDNRIANERFLFHKLGPVSPYKTIDTLAVAKRYFRTGSYALEKLCKKLDLGSKTETKHSILWRSCIDGNRKSWNKMIKYNRQDVKLLHDLYMLLRPYIQNPPNMGLWADGSTKPMCPVCGSNNVYSRGLAKTTTATYRKVQCQDCGHWSRDRVSTKDAKPKLVG